MLLIAVVEAKKHGKGKHGRKLEYESKEYESEWCVVPCSTLSPTAPTPPTLAPTLEPTMQPSNEPSRPPRTKAPFPPKPPVSVSKCTSLCRAQPTVVRCRKWRAGATREEKLFAWKTGSKCYNYYMCGAFTNIPNCTCELKQKRNGDPICNRRETEAPTSE